MAALPFPGDRDFVRHDKHNPCPKCGGANPCRTFADGAVECRRVKSPVPSGSGLGCYIHFPDNGTDWRDRFPVTPAAKPAPIELDPAEVAFRARAFRFLLEHLTLADADREHLRGRGLTDAEIDHDLCRSLPEPGPLREAVARALVEALPDCRGRVPGLYWKDDGAPTLAGYEGIMIPGFGPPDTDGHRPIVGIQTRPNDPAVRAEGKYRHFSSAGRVGGCGSGAHVSVALPIDWQPDGQSIVGEGYLKGNIIAHRTGRAVVSMPGVTIRAGVVPALRALGVERVITAIDNDAASKPEVAQAEAQLVETLTVADLKVDRATWPDMYKGLDEAVVDHVMPLIVPSAPPPAAAAEIPCADLRKRFAELSDLHSAVMALLGNAGLNPAERIVAVMALKNMEVAERSDPVAAEHYIPTERIAEQAGVSTSTAATAIKTIEQGLVVSGSDDADPAPVRLFERKVRWKPDTVNRVTGEVRDVKQTFYSRSAGRLPTDLRVLATATKVKPRAHGGKRITCPDHPDAGVVVKWSRHCAECDRLLERGQRTEAAPDGVNEQDADLLVAADPTTIPTNGPGVNEQDALLVQNPLPSEYVLRSTNLGSSHNDEPSWTDEAPPVDEELVTSVAEAWLAGAALPPRRRLDPVRAPLAAADHAVDRDQRHRANADLSAYLEPLARTRGRSPVPKPGNEAGDDWYTR